MAVLNLTEARIRDLPLGSGIWRDEQAKGLLVVCHKTTKTYAVQGDVRRNGRHIRTVRVKIDRCDRIGLREARRQARELMSRIQSGEDPTARAPETGITIAELLERYVADRELRPTTEESYRTHVAKYLKGYRTRAAADITRQEVRDLYDQLKTRHGKTTASGVMRTFRALLNEAIRIDETIADNPVQHLRIATPKPRPVAPIDLAKWWANTEELMPLRRDLHRAFMFTGIRKTSLLLAERRDIDLERGTLLLRHMKVNGPMIVPLSDFLIELFRRRMDEDERIGSRWLWPAPKAKSGHVEVAREKHKDGFPSPHAYRHLYRTLSIAAGVPYAESALLLGQRLPGASGGYVHPEHLVEHLRKYQQMVTDYLLQSAGVRNVRRETNDGSASIPVVA